MDRAPRIVGCALFVLACSGPAVPAGDLAPSPPDLAYGNAAVAARPYGYRVPPAAGPGAATPLLILLHGLGMTGDLQDAYYGFGRIADEKGFLFAYPDGVDKDWNFRASAGRPDDVAYLGALIDDMVARFGADPRRVYVVGYSNGGAMAYRLACALSTRLAGVVVVSGLDLSAGGPCVPPVPLAMLHVHGDQDEVVSYGGGPGFPSARESVAGWAARNGCGPTPEPLPPLDLDSALGGAETARERWPGCRGGAAELWTLRGGRHIPNLTAVWAPALYDYLAATRPGP